MKEIGLKVRAKVNLALDIKGVYPDGYHALDMIMTSTEPADVIFARKSDVLRVRMDGAICDETNTAHKALRLLESRFGITMEAEIEKHIPFCAGLGGSSADASGILAAAARIYDIPLSRLEDLALRVGADCVYMLQGGNARVRGRGESVEALRLPRMAIAIAQSCQGASTAQVYRAWDEAPIGQVSIDECLAKIAAGSNGYHNALTEAACRLCPSIRTMLGAMETLSDRVFMTGSGSAVVGVFDDIDQARAACQSIRQTGAYCIASHTYDTGIETI